MHPVAPALCAAAALATACHAPAAGPLTTASTPTLASSPSAAPSLSLPSDDGPLTEQGSGFAQLGTLAHQPGQDAGCHVSDGLWLDATPAAGQEAVVELALVLEDGAPFSARVEAHWQEVDGSWQHLGRRLDSAEAHQSHLWGLPPHTDVSIEVSWVREDAPDVTWCGVAEAVRTGSVDTSDLPELEVTHRLDGADVDDVRFLSVLKGAGDAAVVMVDSRGRYVWRQDLDNQELVKAIALHPDSQRLFVALPSDSVDEPATVRIVRPSGEMETIVLDHPLHHGIAFDGEGRLYGIGWETTLLHGEEVLTDTLVRFDVDTGQSEVLWRTFDHLVEPDAERVSELPSTNLYDGDVRAYGYVNGISVNRERGVAALSLPNQDPGILVIDLDTLEVSPVTNGALASAPTGLGLLPSDSVFGQPHHAWADGDGRLVVYNRRDASAGSTVDTLIYDEEGVEVVRSEATVGSDGDPSYNSHLGNVFPVDGQLAAEGGRLAVWSPFADHAYSLRADPFDASADPDDGLMLQVGVASGTELGVVGGFMAAYSVDRLHGD